MERSLPTGTVTFLFTDIEGSTRLLRELGDVAYSQSLAEHRESLRSAFVKHGGVEVDTQGDALFYAFTSAAAGLSAAEDGQAALAGGRIHVRMGLHTGSPVVSSEGYVGEDVHRAARIAAAAHGGQIVLSASTAALAGRGDLVDLGEHRLKDLSAAERIYQSGDGVFPPLKSLYRTNLPVPATPFLGRGDDLGAVRDLLARPGSRLVTLTGVGGTGKTRLALQVAGLAADSYPDGVFWVPLLAITDAGQVGTAVASAIGAGSDVAGWIGSKRMLLLLDNFEHVLDGARDIAGWLQACPNLDVLVTSREALRLAGERRYEVDPMSEVDGVSLFAERARAILADFTPTPAVAEICRRLDNLPLAIELAAARVNVLDPPQLLERLSQRLPLLSANTRDAPVRHRTLRATIEWSYDLLEEDERRLFRRFGCFVDGCSLEAAERVAGADLDSLASLVDKSLIRRNENRFRMLETIREYAVEMLEAEAEAADLRGAHADYYAALAAAANLAAEDLDNGPQYNSVAAETGNLRAAMDWLTGLGACERVLALAVSLEQFWAVANPQEGAVRVRTALDGAPDAPQSLRARGLRVLGGMTFLMGRFDEGVAYYRQALQLFADLGDEIAVAHLMVRLAIDAIRLGNTAEAEQLLSEAEALPTSRADFAQILGVRADLAAANGRPDEALALHRRSIEAAAAVGFHWWAGRTSLQAAELALEMGLIDAAAQLTREALRAAGRIADRLCTVYGLATLAVINAQLGDDEAAGLFWGAVEAETRRLPLEQWETERDNYASRGVRTTDAFEAGRRAGTALSLPEAARFALAE